MCYFNKILHFFNFVLAVRHNKIGQAVVVLVGHRFINVILVQRKICYQDKSEIVNFTRYITKNCFRCRIFGSFNCRFFTIKIVSCYKTANILLKQDVFANFFVLKNV